MIKNLSAASEKMYITDNGIGVLFNDEEFSQQLLNTMQNLESGTEKLDENMEALQHNFLLRGFFRKKAKDEKKYERLKKNILQKTQLTNPHQSPVVNHKQQ